MPVLLQIIGGIKTITLLQYSRREHLQFNAATGELEQATAYVKDQIPKPGSSVFLNQSVHPDIHGKNASGIPARQRYLILYTSSVL